MPLAEPKVLDELNSIIAHCITEKHRTNDVLLLDKEKERFSNMLLCDNVRKGLEQAGFVYPTIIQANAIPIGKAGIDLLIQSKSGTGKTVIYCTILLELYQNALAEPQSLILVPTREIAVQVEGVLNKIGKFSTGFKAICIIGGLKVTDDRKKIQGAKSIVGTPGRILHLIENQILNTSEINILVLDEADKLMTQTFHKDILKIQKSLPTNKQILACSATFSNDFELQLVSYMNNPLLVSTEKRATLLIGIKQLVYELPEQKTSIAEMQSKLLALKKIFSKISFKQCLVFANSQSRADSYRNFLEKDGWCCEIISGAQHQRTRLEMFKRFQDFKTRILISTDLMSRGIDSANVNLVINLELPEDGVTYLHRIGRAGRFGTNGIAITFIASSSDRKKFSQLLDQIDSEIILFEFQQDDTIKVLDSTIIENELPLFRFDTKTYKKIERDQPKKETTEVIDTTTYNIGYEKDAFANKMVLTETLKSDLIIPSSNTIDDASSIAVDSDILQSNSSMGSYELALNSKLPPASLLEVLIDSKKNNFNYGIDLFEDYKKTVTKGTEGKSPNLNKTKCTNWKTILLDSEKPTKLKDIFSEYEKFVNNECNSASYSSKTEDSELRSSLRCQQIPDAVLSEREIIPSNLLDMKRSNLGEHSTEIKPHFPSLKDNSGGCSTVCFSRQSSSGFGEKSSGVASSSSSATISNEHESTSGTYYTTSTDTFENKNIDTSDCIDNEERYETSSSSSNSSASEISCKQYDLYGNNENYQNAYARWINLYWNQITYIQDYVKCSSHAAKRNLNTD